MTNLANVANGIIEQNIDIDKFTDLASHGALVMIVEYAEANGEDISFYQAEKIRSAMNAWLTIVAEGRANQDRRYRIIVEPLQG